ncbi:MAG: DUF481 domain-containing protein [Flavobacteriales bacterium]|nr:DUF481 domain-containing protein [Flavobacteriales bacterium]
MKYLLWLFLLISYSGFSQIVNIENKRLEKKEGFSGNIDLNLNFIMNTKQLLQIGDKLKVAYTKRKSHLLLITDHSFIKSEGQDFVNRGYEHVRFNYTLKDSGRIDYEVFQQGQFNKIQKINLRLLLGTGFRLNLVRQKKYDMNFGTGFMGEYEELIDNGISRDVLSSSYLSFDAQFTPSFGFNTITYFQPKLIDFGNYRLANESYIRLKINKYLTFKVIYSLAHDSRNIPDVRKTNYTLKNTLSFKF